MAVDKAIYAVASAIRESAKLLSQWLSGSEKRRMRRAIEAGEAYIRRNNQIGKRNDRGLEKLEGEFFKFNN